MQRPGGAVLDGILAFSIEGLALGPTSTRACSFLTSSSVSGFFFRNGLHALWPGLASGPPRRRERHMLHQGAGCLDLHHLFGNWNLLLSSIPQDRLKTHTSFPLPPAAHSQSCWQTTPGPRYEPALCNPDPSARSPR